MLAFSMNFCLFPLVVADDDCKTRTRTITHTHPQRERDREQSSDRLLWLVLWLNTYMRIPVFFFAIEFCFPLLPAQEVTFLAELPRKQSLRKWFLLDG